MTESIILIVFFIGFITAVRIAVEIIERKLNLFDDPIEIEDDGQTAVIYFKAPEHRGEIVTIILNDGDLKIFKESERI